MNFSTNLQLNNFTYLNNAQTIISVIKNKSNFASILDNDS